MASSQNLDRIRAEIDRYFSSVSIRSAEAVLDRCDDLEPLGEDKKELVRYCVIDHINRRRPNRRDTLFTGPFEPFLTDDDILVGQFGGIPGLLPRNRIAGLWDVLKRDWFGEGAVEIDRLIAERTADSAEHNGSGIFALSEQLRKPAAGFLGAAFADRELKARLAARLADQWASRFDHDGETAAAGADRIAMRFLAAAGLVLEHAPLLRSAITDFRTIYPEPPRTETDAEKQSMALDRIAREVAAELPKTARTPLALQFVPLVVLNADLRYAVVGFHVRHQVVAGLEGCSLLIEAFTGHLAACRRALRLVFTAALNLDHRLRGATIRIASAERTQLSMIVQRVGRIHDALVIAGIAEDSRTEQRFRSLIADMVQFVGVRVAAVAAERIRIMANAVRTPPADTADLVWLIDHVWQWRAIARRFEDIHVPFETWKREVAEELGEAVERMLRRTDVEGDADRFAHLSRLAAVARVFGLTIMRWVPVSSRTMLDLCRQRLEQPDNLDEDESGVVSAFATLVREELKKSRYWRSQDLTALVRLADQRGY